MNQEQHEQYEYARKRVKQKKRLYYHFVVFLVGSVFLIALNKIFNLGENYIEDWFVWAILAWLFFWILHFINVFVTTKFMGKDWERRQTEKLVLKQEIKIAKMEKQIEKEARLKAESEQFAEEVKAEELKKNSTPKNPTNL